ncbi:hypothetical protein GCM10012287_18360 [Streptomyces daqingensis]|uniref:Uncharacterized protein n=1 Tax=Streptomyces daqingensis TaxID=1472640 RepID=A0ABQ2M4G8_9ACTN|nr:hypothetical protein GCM10012287_18360 [Streptomyces daqingensis]
MPLVSGGADADTAAGAAAPADVASGTGQCGGAASEAPAVTGCGCSSLTSRPLTLSSRTL